MVQFSLLMIRYSWLELKVHECEGYPLLYQKYRVSNLEFLCIFLFVSLSKSGQVVYHGLGYLLGGVDHSKTITKLQGPENSSEHSHDQSACYLLWEDGLIFRQGHRRTDE